MDLHDIINHSKIAGIKLLSQQNLWDCSWCKFCLSVSDLSLYAVLKAAEAQNFLACGAGVFGFRVVDPDNASMIVDGEKVGQKLTNSGYILPELAAIKVFHSSILPPSDNSAMFAESKGQIQEALAADNLWKFQIC